MKKQKQSKNKKSKPAKKIQSRKIKKTIKDAIDTGVVVADQEHQDTVISQELMPPEPWPEAVYGGAVMEQIMAVIQRHLIMKPAEQLAVALWVIYSYCYDLWHYSPFLGFQSPTMRCGKSTALGVVAALANKTLAIAHVTAAAIYRIIDEDSPTVLIDELDRIIHRNRDLHSVLNTAHKRDTAYVPRVVSGKVVRYNVYGPKAMASIGKLPDTVQDRAVVVNLRRKRPDEAVEALPRDPVAFYAELRSKIVRWVEDNRQMIADQKPEYPAGLNDRAADNWRPLLAIARELGPYWYRAARKYALEISRASDAESVDMAEQLLRDIKAVFDAVPNMKKMPVSRLHAALIKTESGIWAEARPPLTKARLARVLNPFGISSKVARLRQNKKVQRVYERSDFDDAFSRYCA